MNEKITGKKLIVSGIIAAGIILAIIGWFILPDILVVQITINGGAGNTLPKLAGIALPLLVNAVFSAAYYYTENKKYLLAAIVGLAAAVFTIAVNL